MDKKMAIATSTAKRVAESSTDRWYKNQPEWGTPESTKLAKKITPGEIEEDIGKMSHGRLKFFTKVPHGSYTRKEIQAEVERRKRTNYDAYTKAKPTSQVEWVAPVIGAAARIAGPKLVKAVGKKNINCH